jgi:GNAT superfamily N-acetyltransferase
VWLEERTGETGVDPGFEAAFEQWWRVELPRRTFWLAEVGSPRAPGRGMCTISTTLIDPTAVNPLRGGRIGHVGNTFVLDAYAGRGLPDALLGVAIEHARQRRYRRLVLAPTAGSAAFYRRAGFVPAGEGLLVLDPSALSSTASP